MWVLRRQSRCLSKGYIYIQFEINMAWGWLSTSNAIILPLNIVGNYIQTLRLIQQFCDNLNHTDCTCIWFSLEWTLRWYSHTFCVKALNLDCIWKVFFPECVFIWHVSVYFCCKYRITFTALVWFFPRMSAHMTFQIVIMRIFPQLLHW